MEPENEEIDEQFLSLFAVNQPVIRAYAHTIREVICIDAPRAESER